MVDMKLLLLYWIFLVEYECVKAVVFPHTDGPEFQESFETSGVFSVTELIQVSRSKSTLDLSSTYDSLLTPI